MPQFPEIPNRIAFTAAAFEGGLVAVAMVLGWAFGVPPLRTFRFDLYGLGVGVVAALPPLVLFWLCVKVPLRPLKTIVKLLDESVVPLFRECELPQLVIIAGLAGVGEEMLFRGIVQAAAMEWIGGAYGEWGGLVVAAVLFGLLHPRYAHLRDTGCGDRVSISAGFG